MADPCQRSYIECLGHWKPYRDYVNQATLGLRSEKKPPPLRGLGRGWICRMVRGIERLENGCSSEREDSVSRSHRVAQLATNINSFLYGACKTVAGASGLIDVTSCIDALSSDSPSSAVDSYKKFAIIAVDLLRTNATSTKSKIDGMHALERWR
uniref:Pectinesterase inhibitor domain-containing protein n=1 Tax=Oryza brachyantha TaxID=4533 RepID=J3LH58_ORYBR